MLDLNVGYRPDFAFPGYWLHEGPDPVVHLIPGPPRAVDVNREGIDHAAFRRDDYDGMRQKLDRLIATDLLKITGGKVTDNWHIGDNLSLQQQMGVDKIGG